MVKVYLMPTYSRVFTMCLSRLQGCEIGASAMVPVTRALRNCTKLEELLWVFSVCMSCVFFCVASLCQWQCQLTNSGNCNRVWDWANLMLTTVTKSKYKQRHRRLGQQIKQWPELELFKSHITLMTEHWKQSNKYLGASLLLACCWHCL